MKKIKILTIFIACFFLLSGLSTASAIILQKGENTADAGSLTILVYENSDEPGTTPQGIGNIEIKIENLDNGYTQTLKTNDKGNCYFEEIPLGVYVIYIDGGASYGNATGKAILTEDNADQILEFPL